MRAGVVAAIADYDQHLLIAATGLQSIQRLHYRVIKRRLARGRRIQDGGHEFLGTICESNRAGQTQGHLLIEVDDEYLVFRIAGPHERAGSGDHMHQFRPHAAAVVDH